MRLTAIEIDLEKVSNTSEVATCGRHDEDPQQTLSRLMEYLMGMTSQVKLFHWGTLQYNIHEAMGTLHDSTQQIMDDIIEGFIARHNIQPIDKTFQLSVEISMRPEIELFLVLHTKTIPHWIHYLHGHDDIVALLHELLNLVYKTLYLVRMSKL